MSMIHCHKLERFQRLLELGQYMHIHWDLLEKGSSSAAPLIDKRSIRAVVLPPHPGSLTLTSERG